MAARWRRDRPMTGPEVEEALLGAIDEMEQAAEDYAARSIVAAEAETVYRRAKAKEMLLAPAKTDAMREAHAIHKAGDLLAERNLTAAMKDSQAEACRVRRLSIEALRTIAVNARAAETGRG